MFFQKFDFSAVLIKFIEILQLPNHTMTSKILIFLYCLISCFCISQNATFKGNKEYRLKMKEKAKVDIKNLKEGILLVRLDSRSEEIKFLREHNRAKRAKKMETRMYGRNLTIVSTFKKHFSFCPVYFFEDTFSVQVLKGDFSNVLFYNDSLKQDQSIVVNSSNYFIAEHGFTQGDTTSYRQDFYIEKNENGLVKEQKRHSEENLNISAFVIRDKSFVQLREPFPYYSKIVGRNPSKGLIQIRIKQFSEAIEDFYSLNYP